jgi:DNA-binding transcriptional ArsR family regulator
MSMPAIAKHLRVLERARLVRRTVDGRVHRCSLEATPLRVLEQWVSTYRGFWGETLEALAEFAEGEERSRR